MRPPFSTSRKQNSEKRATYLLHFLRGQFGDQRIEIVKVRRLLPHHETKAPNKPRALVTFSPAQAWQ